ncbi:unnamed protein product [Merluccius merluccius]
MLSLLKGAHLGPGGRVLTGSAPTGNLSPRSGRGQKEPEESRSAPQISAGGALEATSFVVCEASQRFVC